MKSRWVPVVLIATPLVGAMAAGAIWGFPVFDDAYVVTTLREGPPSDFAIMHRDRPLYGSLLQTAATAFGRSATPYVLLSVAMWMLLAWQTHRLWRRLFPEDADLSLVAAAIVFAPVLVKIQFTTVTTMFPVTLPVVLCLAGLLTLLAMKVDRGWPEWSLACALACAAVVVSEYGLAAAAACVALLLGIRRWRSAAAFALGSGVGYLAFRLLADISGREKVQPAVQLSHSIGHPWASFSLWVSGLGYMLAGAYGEAVAAVRLESDSRSSAIAFLTGLVAAVAAAAWVRSEQVSERESTWTRNLAALLLAVGAGLCIVVLANSSPISEDAFRSRYRFPSAPFAVCVSVAILARVIRPRFRKAVFAALVFLAVWTTSEGAFRARQEQQSMEEIGQRLRPLVRASEGYVVGVLPYVYTAGTTDITPKVTKHWTDEESRRIVVLARDRAAEVIGDRVGCRTPDWLTLRLLKVRAPREGPLARLVWIALSPRGPVTLEPYCLEPGR